MKTKHITAKLRQSKISFDWWFFVTLTLLCCSCLFPWTFFIAIWVEEIESFIVFRVFSEIEGLRVVSDMNVKVICNAPSHPQFSLIINYILHNFSVVVVVEWWMMMEGKKGQKQKRRCWEYKKNYKPVSREQAEWWKKSVRSRTYITKYDAWLTTTNKNWTQRKI